MWSLVIPAKSCKTSREPGSRVFSDHLLKIGNLSLELYAGEGLE
jgi:hypothetical protein